MARPWIILGAKGLLGQALVRELTGRSHRQPRDVLAWDRAMCDITTPHGLRRLAAASPAVILNATAYTAVDKAEQERAAAERVNVHAVEDVGRVAARTGALLVHYSTDFVFDGSASRPYPETHRIRPLGVYGQTKAAGEAKAREVAGRHLVIRTSWLFGPGGNCFPQTMIKAGAAGKALSVVGDQRGTPTHVDDLAQATLALVNAGGMGTFHVTGSGETTWHGFAGAALKRVGIDVAVEAITSAEWQRRRPESAPRPGYSVLDTAKYTSVTGRRMRTWEEMLDTYCAHPTVRELVKR
jgi:dTDP-4-dehydrorhamnose reductase